VTVYYVDDGGSNTSPYDTWAKAATTLATIDAIPAAAPDIVRVDSTHVESGGTAFNWAFADGVILISTNSADDSYQTMVVGGGSIGTTTGTTADVTLNGGASWKGFHFKTADIFFVGTTGDSLLLTECKIEFLNVDNHIDFSNSYFNLRLIDCDIKMEDSGADNQNGIFAAQGDGGSLLMIGGSVTGLEKEWVVHDHYSRNIEFRGVDFSTTGTTAASFRWNKSGNSEIRTKLVGCLLPDITITDDTPTGQGIVEIYRCDAATNNEPWRTEKVEENGIIKTNAATYKTGGYSEPAPTDTLSWEVFAQGRLNATGNEYPFFSFPIRVWYDATVNKDVEIEILVAKASAAVAPTEYDMGVIMYTLASATSTLITPNHVMDDVLNASPTAYTESGTGGDGWTYGGALVPAAYTLTLGADKVIGRKGWIEVVVWVRNFATNTEMFINPQVTLISN